MRDLKKHEFVTDHEEVIKEQSEDDHNSKELRPTSMGKVMSQNFISYRTVSGARSDTLLTSPDVSHYINGPELWHA